MIYTIAGSKDRLGVSRHWKSQGKGWVSCDEINGNLGCDRITFTKGEINQGKIEVFATTLEGP